MYKTIIGRSQYNEAMSKLCQIPADEQIVLELPVGYNKETFKAAVSNRKSAANITCFI